jgi:hypothetical protein
MPHKISCNYIYLTKQEKWAFSPILMSISMGKFLFWPRFCLLQAAKGAYLPFLALFTPSRGPGTSPSRSGCTNQYEIALTFSSSL